MGDVLPAPVGPIGIHTTQSPGTDGTHIHVQDVAATVWTIVHNLGRDGFKAPNVQLFNAAGIEYVTDIDFVDESTLTVTHARPTAGSAQLTI